MTLTNPLIMLWMILLIFVMLNVRYSSARIYSRNSLYHDKYNGEEAEIELMNDIDNDINGGGELKTGRRSPTTPTTPSPFSPSTTHNNNVTGTGHHDFDLRDHPLTLATCSTFILLLSICFEYFTQRLEKVSISNRNHLVGKYYLRPLVNMSSSANSSMFLFSSLTLATQKIDTRVIFKKMLDSLYRELTVIGALSFVLFVSENSGLLSMFSEFIASNIGESSGYVVLEVFHWVHMLVFILVVFFIVICWYLVLVQIWISHRWDYYDEYSYGDICEQIQNYKGRHWFSWEYYNLKSNLDYTILHAGVVERTGVSREFPFSTYLKYCMHEETGKLMHMSPVVVLSVVLLTWIEFSLTHFLPSPMYGVSFEHNSSMEMLAWFVMGLIIFLLTFTLWAKCSSVNHILAKIDIPVAEKYERNKKMGYNVNSHRKTEKELENLYEFHKTHKHRTRERNSDLFWFSRPYLIRAFIQAVFYYDCIFFSLSLYACLAGHQPWYWYAAFIIITLATLGVMMPLVLTSYVKAAVCIMLFAIPSVTDYCGDLIYERLLLRAWDKCRKQRLYGIKGRRKGKAGKGKQKKIGNGKGKKTGGRGDSETERLLPIPSSPTFAAHPSILVQPTTIMQGAIVNGKSNAKSAKPNTPPYNNDNNDDHTKSSPSSTSTWIPSHRTTNSRSNKNV